MSDELLFNYKQFCLLGCKAMKSGESQPTFVRAYRFHLQGGKVSHVKHDHEGGSNLLACFLLGLIFDSENGGGMYLRNIG
jgi:hypothetical protein